ncbi:uncharacterized protein LOC109418896 [Aedes albopictus]|uniref:Odorant receptor n=1 Tax=Aedes albopictus TaxID=7160 RepID=A0ABM1XKC6_AEDAL
MNKITRIWRQCFHEFHISYDYFWLADALCLISEQRPPLTKRASIRFLWTTLSILHAFQYGCFVIQLIHCLKQSPVNKHQFAAIVNLMIPLAVAVVRGMCLANQRESVLKLKRYINSKICQRDDVRSFELRKQQYRKINRNLAAFHCVTTANSVVWALTAGLHGDEVFKVPFQLTKEFESLQNVIDVGYAVLLIPWCFTLWYSPTQFVPILSFFNTELRIIVAQFDGLFENVKVNYTLELNDRTEMTMAQRTRFWAELDVAFKDAISHHSSYISHFELLRKISRLNFFVFLCSSAAIITFNIFPIIVNPSLEHLPLLLLALQYACESYLCCSMFSSLESENRRIAKYVYGIDWLCEERYDAANELDRIHRKSIKQNALILHQRVNKALAVKAGDMFPLTLETFSHMMKSVYSLLTLLLQSMD